MSVAGAAMIIVPWMTCVRTNTLQFINCSECCAGLGTIPVAVRCQLYVCSRLNAGIAGSNPAENVDVSRFVLCVV
jgi:hypothetical protein